MRLLRHLRGAIGRSCAYALLCVACTAWVGCTRPLEVPATLVGTWTTDAPRYQDRHLSITPTTIAFGTGPLTVDVHTLSDVEVTPDPEGGTRYTLLFRESNGAEATLELLVPPETTNTLEIANRDEVWRRTPDAGSEESG